MVELKTPLEERDAKNETNYPPAGTVVGPIMDGVGQRREVYWRHEVIGRKVQVEGIALGKPPAKPSMMTTQRVVYELGVIFIKGVDFAASDAVGKTVRVTGTLRMIPASQMTFDGREPIPVNKYYYIDAEAVAVIDRVTDPHLTLVGEHPPTSIIIPGKPPGDLLFPEAIERAMIPEGNMPLRGVEVERMLRPVPKR